MVDPPAPDGAPTMPDAGGAGTPESPDPLVGTVLAGRYRILGRLGAGAMGSVYLGEHLRFGRKDAIKVLQGGVARDKEATDRFLRGARNASAINHPNVCTVYDFGDTDDGQQFLAMEFVDGECLSDIIDRDGPVPLRRGLEITRQIGEALDAAHHLGIVHRDLKPGNVMVVEGRDGRDVVKVVDFDIAKGTAEGEGAEVTRTGFVVGTPEYMSPEQLIGDPLDGRSDIYSLALVFSRIVTGRLPVRSTSTQDLMVERLTQEPLRLSEIAPELLIPSGVQAAIDHALARRREDRPATAAAFVAELLRGARSDSGASSAAAHSTPSGGSSYAPPPGPSGVPQTQVGAPAGAPSSTARPDPGLRRLLPILVGGIVVMAAGVGVIRFLSGDGGAEAGPPTPVDSGQVVDSGRIAVLDDTASGPEDPPSDPPVRPSDERQEDAPVDPPVDPPIDSPTDTPEDTGPVGPTRLTTAAAEALLARQLDRLNDSPGPATYAVVTDSARFVYEQEDLPADVRARAAFIRGDGLFQAGRVEEARTWFDRAVNLDPDNQAYIQMRRAAGGGA